MYAAPTKGLTVTHTAAAAGWRLATAWPCAACAQRVYMPYGCTMGGCGLSVALRCGVTDVGVDLFYSDRDAWTVTARLRSHASPVPSMTSTTAATRDRWRGWRRCHSAKKRKQPLGVVCATAPLEFRRVWLMVTASVATAAVRR